MRAIYNIPNIICIKLLALHTEPVEDVVIDEEVVISSSRDKTIRVWNKKTWECESVLEGHEDRIISLAINEKYIVSGSLDQTIRVWERSSGDCKYILKGHKGGINDIDISGNLMASASDDTTVKLWDLETGSLIKTLEGHQRIVSRVRIRGNNVFTSSWDHFIRTFDIETGECIESYEVHFDAIDAMDVDTEGNVIVSGDQSSIINIWDRRSQKVIHRLKGHNHFIMDLVIDGGILYSCSQDKTVMLWDLENGICLKKLEGALDSVMNVAKYKNLIASSSADGTIRIWDDFSTHSKKILKRHEDIVLGIAANDDVVVSVGTENRIFVWDLEQGKCIKEIDIGINSWVWGIAFENEKVIISSDEGIYRIFDVNTGELLTKLEKHKGPTYRVSLKGNIATTSSFDNTVKVWNIENGECLRTLRGHTFPSYTNVIMDEKTVVSGGSDGSVRIWDIDTGDCLKVFRDHNDEVFQLAREGDIIVSASADKTIRAYDIKTQKCIRTLKGHSDQVWTIQIKNGIVFSGSLDSTIKIWDLEKGICLETFKGHSGAVKDLCIVGNYLISGSKDALIKVWDISKYLESSQKKENNNKIDNENKLTKIDEILVALLQIGRAYNIIPEELGDPDIARFIYGLDPIESSNSHFKNYKHNLLLLKNLVGSWRMLGHLGLASWVNDIVSLGRDNELEMSENESLDTILHEYLAGLKDSSNMYWLGLLRYLGENPKNEMHKNWSFNLDFSGQGPTPIEGFVWEKITNRDNIFKLDDRHETALVFRLTLKNVLEWLIPIIKSINIQIKDDRGDLETCIFNNFLPMEENNDIWNAIAMFKIDPGYCNEPNAILEITDIQVNYDEKLVPIIQSSAVLDRINNLQKAQNNLNDQLNKFKTEIQLLLSNDSDKNKMEQSKKEIKFSEVDLKTISMDNKYSLLGVKNSGKSSRVFDYFKNGFNKPGFDTITVNIGGTFSKFLENIEPKFILFSTITSITSAILSLFVYLTIFNPGFNIFGSAFEIFGDVYTVLEIVVYFLINGLLIIFLLISVILWVKYYRKKKKMRFQV